MTEEKVPCDNCICMAICRIKIIHNHHEDLWEKLWSFCMEDNTCCLLKKYLLTGPGIDIKIIEGKGILKSLQIIDGPDHDFGP